MLSREAQLRSVVRALRPVDGRTSKPLDDCALMASGCAIPRHCCLCFATVSRYDTWRDVAECVLREYIHLGARPVYIYFYRLAPMKYQIELYMLPSRQTTLSGTQFKCPNSVC